MNAIDIIKGTLPFIGTALAGPLGTGVASFVASKLGIPPAMVTDTLTAMVDDPALVVKAQELDTQYKEHLAELGYKSLLDIETLNASVVTVVNETIRAEIASEHWVSYSWRPFIGFMFGVYIASLWILPLFGKTPVTLSADITLAVGGILGVASYFRGKAQADPSIQTKTVTSNG